MQDGFLGHINSYVQSLNNKLQFTVSLVSVFGPSGTVFDAEVAEGQGQ